MTGGEWSHYLGGGDTGTVLDHENHRCSLKGATTTSSFESVDDEQRRMAGRRKPDNE
jgi:hypothetical protein